MLARFLIAIGFFLAYFLAPIPRPIWLTFIVALVAFGLGRLAVFLIKRVWVQRLIATGVVIAGGTVGLVWQVRPAVVSYVEASDLARAPRGDRIRLHGHVEPGTLVMRDGARFKLEGGVPVAYEGVLPDGFRERTEVVVSGRLVDGVFQAETVLAKCPDRYR